MSDDRIAEIRARAEAYREHSTLHSFACCSAHSSADDVPWLLAELAKYVGQEPTLEEEALHEHEEQLREKVADEIWRAPKPQFAANENADMVWRTTRSIYERLARVGPASDYWTRPGTEAPQ